MRLSFECSNLWSLDVNYYDRTEARCGQLINAVTAVHLGSACVALLALLSDILQGTHFVAYAPLVWLCALACVAGRHQRDYRRARSAFYERHRSIFTRGEVIATRECLSKIGLRLPEAAVAQQIVATTYYLRAGNSLKDETLLGRTVFKAYGYRECERVLPEETSVIRCACPH